MSELGNDSFKSTLDVLCSVKNGSDLLQLTKPITISILVINVLKFVNAVIAIHTSTLKYRNPVLNCFPVLIC